MVTTSLIVTLSSTYGILFVTIEQSNWLIAALITRSAVSPTESETMYILGLSIKKPPSYEDTIFK